MIINPYDKKGNWFKGNLHTHTEHSPCGHYSLEKVIEMYKSYKMKYDFLAITDHYSLTDVQNFMDEELLLFSGVEYKTSKYQTLGINVSAYEDDKDKENNHQDLFNSIMEQGGINIICHPHQGKYDYWPYEKLISLWAYCGIEIFNNNVKFDNKGRALAVDLWDRLLTSGRYVYGFANDDMHVFSRAGGAFNMVLAEEKSKESILKSIKMGSFYCSTGIYLKELQLVNNRIYISLLHNIPVRISFIGSGGKVLKESFDIEADYCINGNEKYVRVEIHREDGAMAWSQPFFLE